MCGWRALAHTNCLHVVSDIELSDRTRFPVHFAVLGLIFRQIGTVAFFMTLSTKHVIQSFPEFDRWLLYRLGAAGQAGSYSKVLLRLMCLV